MMLEDEGFMNEVKFQIKAGISAAEAMYRVGNRYAEQLWHRGRLAWFCPQQPP